ncbi:MAG: hypothetical protein NUV84_00910 [Candidatus Uhrbacteria bacterium]|nr:hypothetical protein [Candidatus Uhrbacteria bacterium]
MSSNIPRQAGNLVNVFHPRNYVNEDDLYDGDDPCDDLYEEDDNGLCSCDDCRDYRSSQWAGWGLENREGEIDALPVDDFDEVWYLDAEDFGLSAYEPRPEPRSTTYHQPAEKGWRGPQWARHLRRDDRRNTA